MSPVIVEKTGSSIVLKISSPESNGAQIIEYRLDLKTSDGNFSPLEICSSDNLKSSLNCEVNMKDLR